MALVLSTLLLGYASRAPFHTDLPRSAVRMSALPPAVSKLLPPQAEEDDEILAAIVPLWEALAEVYPSEAAAVAAVRKNVAVILPYMNQPTNIEGSWDVIVVSAPLPQQSPHLARCTRRAARTPARLALPSPQPRRRAIAGYVRRGGGP